MPGELEVALTGDQLHALCVALSWLVEDDHVPAELADVCYELESAQELLMFAWADAQLAGWVGTDGQSEVA